MKRTPKHGRGARTQQGGSKGRRRLGPQRGELSGDRKREHNVTKNSGKGPRLSGSLLRAIGLTEGRNENSGSDDSDEDIAEDVYEYEEEVPEEERGKNKRFDEIERMEYELPSDFELQDTIGRCEVAQELSMVYGELRMVVDFGLPTPRITNV